MFRLHLWLYALFIPTIYATHLTDSLLNQVYNVMNTVSTASWENGTKAEAILEATYPTLSVYSTTSPFSALASLSSGQVPQIIDIAQTTMQNRPSSNSSAATLLQDGAAGDPASLGVTILIANASTDDVQINGVGYGQAATAELNYLLYEVPRTSSGAISHRADQAQLWADSVYMVPPFLAYFGALTSNRTLLTEAYQQCSLYRDALKQSNNLWYHIVGGNGTFDANVWATGNAWAVAGMLRVWATIKWSSYASDLASQMSDLEDWIGEIFTAAESYITTDGLLHNYITDNSTFEDASASALFAATGLRLSTENITNSHVNSSLALLTAVSNKVNSTGYVTQVVDPFDFSKQSSVSAEAQSFVVMAYAAYKEWDSLGRSGGGIDSSKDLGPDSAAPPLLSTSCAMTAFALTIAMVLVSL